MCKLCDNYPGMGVHPQHEGKCPKCGKGIAQIKKIMGVNGIFMCLKCERKSQGFNLAGGYTQTPTVVYKDTATGRDILFDQKNRPIPDSKNPYLKQDKYGAFKQGHDKHGWGYTHTKEYKRYLRG